LGTEDEFKALVSEAHKVGLKIILDVVANQTADVIQYKNNQYGYIGSNEFAYKDAKGKVFDVKKVAGKETFPKLSVTKSFPRIPIVSPANAKIKNPAWLNDLTNYHNRGNSSFNGESSLDGDFYGLDDIFTEKPEVVQGWIDIWSYWINNFDIDGLRIDTLKHVNPSFWQTVIPRIQKVAQLKGKTDFPIFGEVYDADPFVLSSFIRSKQSPSLLDFTFQKNVVGFARSGDSSQALVSLFNADDLYVNLLFKGGPAHLSGKIVSPVIFVCQ
jgi:glycosidase